MHTIPRAFWVMIFALALIIGGVCSLMLINLPAPQQVYEKPLEIKPVVRPVIAPLAPVSSSTPAPTPPPGE